MLNNFFNFIKLKKKLVTKERQSPKARKAKTKGVKTQHGETKRDQRLVAEANDTHQRENQKCGNQKVRISQPWLDNPPINSSLKVHDK